MKKIFYLIGTITLVVAIMFSLVACVGTPPPEPAPQPVSEPVVEPTPQQPPPPPPPPPPSARTSLILDGASNYTVKSGDTLVDIAKHFYNNGYYYPVIVAANGSLIQNPDKIDPGLQIIIPDLQRNLNDSGARGIVKQALTAGIPFEQSRSRNETADGMRELSNSL
jgi:hypothetical protein